jgi:histidine triad (HIT) family protein
MDCLFCKIANGEIPSNKVYEDEKILAFRDIAPQAETHVLVIPKGHIASSANDINVENCEIVGYIFAKIPEIAKLSGVDSYRIINNCGDKAGQTVKHIHFHILSGDNLSEKLV